MRSEPLQNGFLACSLMLLFAAAFLQGVCHAAEERTPAPSEYQVKAAFVYNFIKFIEWPEAGDSRRSGVHLCLLGDVPDAAAFDGLNGQQVRGEPLTVSILRQSPEIRGCDVLFLAANQAGALQDVIASLEDLPTLTIGDTEGFARKGVMINMFFEGKRVRFEINEDRARAAGLRISVKLLKLASKVYGAAKNREP